MYTVYIHKTDMYIQYQQNSQKANTKRKLVQRNHRKYFKYKTFKNVSFETQYERATKRSILKFQ